MTGNTAGGIPSPADVSDTANNEGGGLQNREAGTAIIQNASVFSENSTTAGGGVANYGMLTINDATVSINLSTWGGGILNFGTVEATGSTISTKPNTVVACGVPERGSQYQRRFE